MKKTISGVHYDTERDEEIYGETLDEKGVAFSLRKTPAGCYYVLGLIPQMYSEGIWQVWSTRADLVSAGIPTGGPIDEPPDPRLRLLETIRPLTRAEALRWWAENFTPDEFKAEVLGALPKGQGDQERGS